MRLALVNKFQQTDMLLAAGMYVIGIVLGATVIDLVASFPQPLDPTEPEQRSGTALRLCILLLLPVIAVGTRLYFFDDWNAIISRCAAQLGTGFLIAAAHWVFFTFVRGRNAPVYYCFALGAGLALSEIQWRILFADHPEDVVNNAVIPHHRLAAVATLFFSLAVAAGIAAAFRREPEASDSGRDAGGSWKAVAAILLPVVMLFLLHGVLNRAFMPFFAATRVRDAIGMMVVFTAAAYCVCGWLFSRDFAKWYRFIAIACAVIHLTLPAFSLFRTNVPGLRVVHTLSGPLQNIFLAATVAALAVVAPPRWRAPIMTAPIAIRVLVVTYVPFLLRDIPRDGEALPLTAVMVAVAFFLFVQRIDFSALDDAPLPETPTEDAVAGTDVDRGERDVLRLVMRELAAAHGLSSREREVAELLASGMTTEAIGARLGLATNTVHTYIRRVVLKTRCGGRRHFVNMVTEKVDAEN